MLVALKKMRRGDKFIYNGLLCTFLGEEDGSIRLTAVPLSFIEPILLTPEILEQYLDGKLIYKYKDKIEL